MQGLQVHLLLVAEGKKVRHQQEEENTMETNQQADCKVVAIQQMEDMQGLLLLVAEDMLVR